MNAVDTPFAESCRRSVTRLRTTVLELYRSVSAEPDKPQEVSRRFGVNRNLAWQISRILREVDALSVIPLVPKPGAVDIMLEAMGTAGAPKEMVRSAKVAFDEFDAMVQDHVGDRGELDILLDSMGQGSAEPLELSRKLAFRGNSGLWGLQVATRVTSQFIAPSPDDPNMLDAIQIAGLHRTRRLRSIASWPVFRIGRITPSQTPEPDPNRIPLDPSADGHSGLMSAFSSGPLPELTVRQRGEGLYYDIGDGPIGRRGEFSCYFGYLHKRFVPRYATGDGVAKFAAVVTMPAEVLQFDVFIHEDLQCQVNPQAEVFGQLWDEGGKFQESTKLPLAVGVIDLGRGGRPGSRLVDGYDDLTAAAFERAGWSPDAFRCHRVLIDYPPMTSVATIRLNLPRARE